MPGGLGQAVGGPRGEAPGKGGMGKADYCKRGGGRGMQRPLPLGGSRGLPGLREGMRRVRRARKSSLAEVNVGFRVMAGLGEGLQARDPDVAFPAPFPVWPVLGGPRQAQAEDSCGKPDLGSQVYFVQKRERWRRGFGWLVGLRVGRV